MSTPVIQYFGRDGTWVKPAGAVRVDVVLQGAGGGHGWTGTCADLGRRINPNGILASNGEPGEIRVSSWAADDLDDTVEVTIGKGGRPGGRDGYALIITHLADGQAGELDPAAALVIATLRAMGDDAYQQVEEAMRGWDRADYEGDYPFGQDDQDDENNPEVNPEVCDACGGKVRFGICRECGVTYAPERTVVHDQRGCPLCRTRVGAPGGGGTDRKTPMTDAYAVITPAGELHWYPLTRARDVEALVGGTVAPGALDTATVTTTGIPRGCGPLKVVASDIGGLYPDDYPANPLAGRVIAALSGGRRSQAWHGTVALVEYEIDEDTREVLWPGEMSPHWAEAILTAVRES